jgi:hypothetical protein
MWYSVSLLFKSVHLNLPPEQDYLWEESIFLVRAAGKEEAHQAGERIGKEQEHEYVSATGDLVRWTFTRVESVCEILDEQISDGTEVFSRFLDSREITVLLGSTDDSSNGAALTGAPPPSRAPSP